VNNRGNVTLVVDILLALTIWFI